MALRFLCHRAQPSKMGRLCGGSRRWRAQGISRASRHRRCCASGRGRHSGGHTAAGSHRAALLAASIKGHRARAARWDGRVV